MEAMEALKEALLCRPKEGSNYTDAAPVNFTGFADIDLDMMRMDPGFAFAMSGGSDADNVTCLEYEAVPFRDGFKKVMDELNIYFTPVIIVIGVTGNFLSFLVFTTTHLRRQSSSVYLASLAMVDIGFLLSLCVVWLGWIKVPLFHQNVICQTVVYLTYVCTFLSVWLVVSFTVERYIIVWYPLRKDRFCTRKRARIVVTCLSVCAFAIYSFATWTSGIIYIKSVPLCTPFHQYYNFITAMTSLDSCITLIVPSTVVIILNIRIAMKINSVQKQRQHLIRYVNYTVTSRTAAQNEHVQNREKRFSLHESFSSSRAVHVRFHDPSQSSGDHEKRSSESDSNSWRKCQTRVQVKNSTQYRTARMLIVVSTVFVVLNTPSHVFRINAFIQSSLRYEFNSSRKDLSWHEIFQLVYHLNFALNFFIYSVCGNQFRTGLRILYSRLVHKARRIKQLVLVKSEMKADV